MNLFTYVWTLVLFYGLFSKNIKTSVYILLISMIFQCTNYLSFDSLACGPQVVTSIFFIAKSLMYKKKKKTITPKKNISKKKYIIWMILITNIFINAITNSILTLNLFLRIMQLLCYIISFWRLYKISHIFTTKDIEKLIKVITIILLVAGFTTIIINITGINKFNILQSLLYNDLENSANIFYYKD